MVIQTNTTIALRCPRCGTIGMYPVSRFALQRDRLRRLDCSCGERVASVGSRSGVQVWVQIPCQVCGTEHFIYFSSREFWSGELHHIYCAETGVEIGFFGSEPGVEELAGRADMPPAGPEESEDDYFINPAVMFEVLNYVHDLAERNKLSCLCGNLNLKIEICPGHIEIQCPQCSRRLRLPATRDEDARAVRGFRTIQVIERGWKLIREPGKEEF